jgi:hypothetical protein
MPAVRAQGRGACQADEPRRQSERGGEGQLREGLERKLGHPTGRETTAAAAPPPRRGGQLSRCRLFRLLLLPAHT